MPENPDISITELQQYKAILEKTHIVSKADSEGRIIYVNDQFSEMTGYSREELVGKPHSILGSTTMPQESFDAMWSSLRLKKPWSGIVEEHHKEGNAFRVKVQIFPILKASGATVNYVVVYHEVSDSPSEERVLEEIDRRQQIEQHLDYLQNIIDQQHNIIIVSNGAELVLVNNQFLEFFTMPTIEAFKLEFSDISNAFVRHDNYFHLGKVVEGGNWVKTLQALADEKSVVSMVDLRSSDPRAFAVKVSHLEDDSDYYVVSFTDITDLTIKANQYFYEATHDKLTGSMNRSHFSEVLAEKVEEAKRADTSLSLLMIGIDDFKAINTRYGSQKGDNIIKNLAETVTMHLRMNDELARWGGVEFGLLMPGATLEKAEKMAKNIHEAVAMMQTYIDEEVTVSIAIALLDDDTDSRTFVLRAYDALSVKRDEKSQP